MKAEKDIKTGKWLIQYRYTDWQGNRKKSTKRGFDTKREAEQWYREFSAKKQQSSATDISKACDEVYKIKEGKIYRS